MGGVKSPEAVCEEARRCRRAKRLVRAFGQAAADLQQAI